MIELDRGLDPARVGERDPKPVLGQHLRIDDEPAQVALAVVLRTMHGTVHGDGEALAQHHAGDDLFGRLRHRPDYSNVGALAHPPENRKCSQIHGSANR